MNIEIIRIGNSQGIRIPKSVLQQCGLVDRAELTVEDGCLILKKPRVARQGWSEAFEEMAKRGDDAPLFPDHSLNSFDDTEWEW